MPSLLQQLVYLLASGEAPTSLASYLAGGNLVALMKVKEDGDWDVRHIAVGEILHRLTGKYLCSVTKIKGQSVFSTSPVRSCMPCMVIVHKVCSCRELLGNGDFGALKIDMHNVSQGSWLWIMARSISLSCLLPWMLWCYSQHPLLWHASGVLPSADGVQQGDPCTWATAIWCCTS